MQEILVNEHIVAHHECTRDATLKLNAALDCFQDIAACHADWLKIGMMDLQEQHQLWVLSRLKLKLHRMPGLGEKITIMTYPTGLNKLFAVRQYQMLDAQGNQLITGTSFWLVIDDQKFRPARPMPFLADFAVRNSEKECFYPDVEKLPEPETALEPLLHYTVLESNIDLNRHLNNAYYGAFIVDVLAKLAGQICHPKELQINFLHAGALYAEIDCSGQITENGNFYIEGRLSNGKQLCFQAAGTL